jgi:hypothetical protein
VVCPYTKVGCEEVLMREDIEAHMRVCKWKTKDVVEHGESNEVRGKGGETDQIKAAPPAGGGGTTIARPAGGGKQ